MLDPSASHPEQRTANLRPGGVDVAELAPPEALAARLAEDLAAAWRRGERPRAEDYLARHPELHHFPEAAVRLVYEEVCQRQEVGLAVAPAEVVRRFPQWRTELEILLDCHSLLQDTTAPPDYPAAGDRLGDLELTAELGRGAQGRVFLARQSSLADRPVVLKLTPCDGREHLSLARLQHTHIVPLYWVRDLPDRHLRMLCMPYLGGATLADVLARLHGRPAARRTGRDLLEALGKDEAATTARPVARLLGRLSYVQAVCWIGACLADALHYAHERGLVHLDLKPSNVLLANGGEPLLLDFHLARGPLRPDSPPPDWFGGTPDYMSPEQKAALDALRHGRPVPAVVDERSDVYALGWLLYEALGGVGPRQSAAAPGKALPRLDGRNPQVSTGLADVIEKCLRAEAGARYADAGELAADLRRHLSDLPLQGVANRSWRERWRKWRRRRPYALFAAVLAAVILGAGITAGAVVHHQSRRDLGEAAALLAEGRRQQRHGDFTQALQTLARGQSLATAVPGGAELAQAFDGQLRQARRAQAAHRLGAVVQRLRFLHAGTLAPGEGRALEANCRAVWERRGQLLDRTDAELGAEAEQRLETDLLDLATIWVSLHADLAPKEKKEASRQKGLEVLAEAERLFGPSPALEQQRHAQAVALGWHDEARVAARRAAALPPRNAWERFTVGRFLYHAGEPAKAAVEFARAVEEEPGSFWPNFYQGLCAYRLGQHEEAVQAFGVCVALLPRSAECYYNRALAHAAREQTDRALRDYDRALELDSRLAPAYLNRGLLHYRARHYRRAADDLERALQAGAEPARVHYNLGLVYADQGDRRAARRHLSEALRYEPGHPDARVLLDKVEKTNRK